MNPTNSNARRLTWTGGTEIIGSVAALVIGALFAAEGLLGYFYNYSIFWEGLDHTTEIYGGFAVAIIGFVAAVYVYVRR
jgi:hypothetical protein